jgi:DNA-binding transcriptional ArsR family regulator
VSTYAHGSGGPGKPGGQGGQGGPGNPGGPGKPGGPGGPGGPGPAAEPLAALADPTRRAIFERLAEGPQAVGELASGLPVSRPAVSQHLKVLKDARLVIDRRDGNRSIYQVNPDGLKVLRAYLDQFWKRALAAYKRAAEQRAEEVR